jgi:RimJ/RimL family protein N-acetyltransferase
MNTNGTASHAGTTTYRVRVRGHLDDHWSARLGGFTITRQPDGDTTLTGVVADQAQLHGVLIGVRDVGVELLSLDTVVPREPALSTALSTHRLTLRPAVTDDTAPTWEYRQLPEVNEWLTGGPDTFTGYRDLFTDPDRLATTVIVELRDGTLVGDFMMRRRDAWSQSDVFSRAAGQEVELGWVLHPAHTGHGYATEAVQELLRHCFVDLGIHRVTAGCFTANDTSWRLMDRVGMRREAHTRRDALHRSGRWLDSYTYAVLADEWPTLSRGVACTRTST